MARPVSTHAILITRLGSVHRASVLSDGSPGTGCGQDASKSAPVRPVQALVYHLHECHAPGCWANGMWARFMEGVLN